MTDFEQTVYRKSVLPALRGWEDELGVFAWEPRLIEILRRPIEEIVNEAGDEVSDDSMTRAARVFRLRYEDRYGNLLNLKRWAIEQTGEVAPPATPLAAASFIEGAGFAVAPEPVAELWRPQPTIASLARQIHSLVTNCVRCVGPLGTRLTPNEQDAVKAACRKGTDALQRRNHEELQTCLSELERRLGSLGSPCCGPSRRESGSVRQRRNRTPGPYGYDKEA